METGKPKSLEVNEPSKGAKIKHYFLPPEFRQSLWLRVFIALMIIMATLTFYFGVRYVVGMIIYRQKINACLWQPVQNSEANVPLKHSSTEISATSDDKSATPFQKRIALRPLLENNHALLKNCIISLSIFLLLLFSFDVVQLYLNGALRKNFLILLLFIPICNISFYAIYFPLINMLPYSKFLIILSQPKMMPIVAFLNMLIKFGFIILAGITFQGAIVLIVFSIMTIIILKRRGVLWILLLTIPWLNAWIIFIGDFGYWLKKVYFPFIGQGALV